MSANQDNNATEMRMLRILEDEDETKNVDHLTHDIAKNIDEEDPDHDIHQSKYQKVLKDSVTTRRVIYFCGLTIFLLGLTGCVASMTVPSLRRLSLRGIEMWKWWMLLTALLGGPVLSRGILKLILLCLDREKAASVDVIYYVVGLVESAWVVLWCGIILLAWEWVVDEPSYLGVPQENKEKLERKFAKTERILTLTLITILVGSFLWLVKELVIMITKSFFHTKRFFDRIRETLMHEYMIDILSGSPRENKNGNYIHHRRHSKKCCWNKHGVFINFWRLEKKNQENVTCWEMKILIKQILEGRPLIYMDKGEKKEIRSESDAIYAANVIFDNQTVHHYYDGEVQISYIKTSEVEAQLSEYLKDEKDMPQVVRWLLVGADDPNSIEREAFTKFMVNAWKYRTSLFHSLVDNKGLFQGLNIAVNVILIFVIFIGWLVVLDVQIRKAMFVVGSAIVGSAFIFGEFSKKVLDDFMFIFVVHPFDVGDCCLIDNTPVIIEDITLLTTAALTLDDELRHYPNSSLCNLTITNYTRSPPHMGDSVVFYLDIGTAKETIEELKRRIKKYIETKSHYWRKEHELVMEFDSQSQDSTKIKATLHFKHTINYHDLRQIRTRRSKLISELKIYLNDLKLMSSATTLDQQKE